MRCATAGLPRPRPGRHAALALSALLLACAAPERGKPSAPDALAASADTAGEAPEDGASPDAAARGGDVPSRDDTSAPEEDAAESPDAGPPPPSFADEVHPLLVGQCGTVGCHGSAAGGYSLTGAVASDYSATLERVTPGDPDGSKLLKKATGVSSHSGGPVLALGSADYERVASWIRGGANP